MTTMEKLNSMLKFKLIDNIYDGTYECSCGKRLGLLDLEYGDVGESLKCHCGEHYFLSNDEEIKLIEEYSYSYQGIFVITKNVFLAKADSSKKYIKKKNIRKSTDQLFLDLRDEGGEKTLDFYYFDCSTNRISTKNEDFFRGFNVGKFKGLSKDLKDLCVKHNIKPNYGELFEDFCKFDNMFNYDELFRIVFTDYFVELFVKSGFSYLISTNLILSKELIQGSIDINYNANNISNALGIPQKAIKFIAYKQYSVAKISMIQGFFRTRNIHEFKVFIMDENSIFDIHDLGRIESLLSNGYSPEKLCKYIKTICVEERLKVDTALMLLDDAYRMSRDLEVDFRPYSKNLKSRHDRLQEQYMIVKNEIDTKRLKEVGESFKIKQVGDTYFAKVLDSIEDFRYEGEGQRNCVLSYVSRVVKGKIVIIAIRKRENPEKTFVTVELQENKIVQAKGFANSSLEPEAWEYLTELAIKNNWSIARRK